MATEIVRPPRSAGVRWPGLAAFGLAVTAVAVFGALAITGTSSEYASLRRPGVGAAVVGVRPRFVGLARLAAGGAHAALVPYAAQLLLNAAWTPLFFGAGKYGWALVDIVALWFATTWGAMSRP